MLVKGALSSLALAMIFYAGLAPSLVEGNGMMTNTPPRLVPGDEDRNFQFATSPNNKFPCGGLQRGQTKGAFKEAGKLPLNWAIKTPRGGPCLFELSTNGQDSNFRPILKVNKCGDKKGDDNTQIDLPAGLTCDRCTVRFRWVSQRPRLNFVNCADISISKRAANELPAGGGAGGGGGGRGRQQGGGRQQQGGGRRQGGNQRGGARRQQGGARRQQGGARRVRPRSFNNSTLLYARDLGDVDEEFEQLWNEALLAGSL
ncbi:uncharacterized protein VTP21DRAFT_1653 [Calcarisporiella thermophila]|uniref:uncharacterized protein n=1 Tax=Calcarisporiella thermophila TaxID=911321 RepID=UPI0037444EC3